MSEERSASGPTALVTGAASGIGAAFARALAGEGYRLILVDRDEARLKAVAGELSAETVVAGEFSAETVVAGDFGAATAVAGDFGAEVIVADLTAEADLARVEARCREGVDLLVNNAGFGHPTEFLATPVEAEIAMARLHMEVVLRLTLAALPSMMDRRSGGVINLASVLGFFPSSTYSASKAWVANFSQSTSRSTLPANVAVTALCPGFTRTAFHGSAGMDMTGIPRFLWLDADTVVAAALRDWRRGRSLSVPGWQNKTIVALSRLLPMRLINRIMTASSDRPMAVRSH